MGEQKYPIEMKDGFGVNVEQEAYVIATAGGGYSTLGFKVAAAKMYRYALWVTVQNKLNQATTRSLSDDVIHGNVPPAGTREDYETYKAVVAEVIDLCNRYNIRCDADLSPQLLGLENARVEVLTMYGETRRFWVGKSSGVIPIHLEIHNTRSMGGGAAEQRYERVTLVRRK